MFGELDSLCSSRLPLLHETLATTLFHVTNHEVNMSANTSERVQKHRQALRNSGMRPIQIWVPDTRRLGFAEECRRQSLLLRGDILETDTLDWLASVADTEGWK